MATIIFIATASELSTILPTLLDLPTSPPSLYLDLEGAKLSRYGIISLLTLYVLPTNTVHIIDIHTLGATAFSTPAQTHRNDEATEMPLTLKSILESPTVPKVFFDVRNDSDALFSHFSIHLACITDLQLMELGTTRRSSRTFLAGLSKCIQFDSALPLAARQHASTVKEAGTALFAPEKGGSYAVFDERPLKAGILGYCLLDLVHMPELWKVYKVRMDGF
jgi:exonuclease 3'-5' domain-containing protein 1